MTDDTVAVQNALDALTDGFLFVPAGTYPISSIVRLRGGLGVTMVGADPATSIFKWVGASGSKFFHMDGSAYCRVCRLTFDGNGLADTLVDQSAGQYAGEPSGGATRLFGTGNEYSDLVLKGAQQNCIQAGDLGVGEAESSVVRCKFVGANGIFLRGFNCLDWWVHQCEFRNVSSGVTNGDASGPNAGAGNFHVYDSAFYNSFYADLQVTNTQSFNFRDNYSENSNLFLLEAYYFTNAAQTRMTGNKVVVSVNGAQIPMDGVFAATSVYHGNMGPLVSNDNVFQSSAADVRGMPVIKVDGQYPPDCISVGDTFTVGNDISDSGRLLTIDDVVTPVSLVAPAAFPTPPSMGRQLFEVPVGDNGTLLQAAITSAAALNGQRPIVHLSKGSYTVASTIVVPACDVQIIGDGRATVLTWAGSASGLMFQLQGPSHVIMRDLYLNGNFGSASILRIDGADQVGGRVYVCEPILVNSDTGLKIESIGSTLVEVQDSNIFSNTSKAANITDSRNVAFLAGLISGNPTDFLIVNSNVVLRDLFHDSGASFVTTYADISGTSAVTIEGCSLNFSSNNSDVIQLSGGDLTLLSTTINATVHFTGGTAWAVGSNQLGAVTNFFTGSGTPILVQNRQYLIPNSVGSTAVADSTPAPTSADVRTRLAQSRAVHATTRIKDLSASVTDVRLYRIWAERAINCIYVRN